MSPPDLRVFTAGNPPNTFKKKEKNIKMGQICWPITLNGPSHILKPTQVGNEICLFTLVCNFAAVDTNLCPWALIFSGGKQLTWCTLLGCRNDFSLGVNYFSSYGENFVIVGILFQWWEAFFWSKICLLSNIKYFY